MTDPVRRNPAMPVGSTIDGDVGCRGCGYNLRGLSYGQNCPECGAPIRVMPATTDVLLAGTLSERRRWRSGLALIALAVGVAMVVRVAYFLAAVRGASGVVVTGYVGIGAVNGLVWIAGVWLVTPVALERRWRWMRGPRLAARLLSLFWIPGYACLIMRHGMVGGAAAPPYVLAGDLGGRFLGGLGVLFVVFILSFVAEEAELPAASRRLNAALWLLWFPTLLAQAFPSSIAWFTLILLGMVLFFWCWLMTLMLLGAVALHGHVRWAEVHDHAERGRAGRIAERRRELEREAARAVRPVGPGPGGDVGMERRGGSSPR